MAENIGGGGEYLGSLLEEVDMKEQLAYIKESILADIDGIPSLSKETAEDMKDIAAEAINDHAHQELEIVHAEKDLEQQLTGDKENIVAIQQDSIEGIVGSNLDALEVRVENIAQTIDAIFQDMLLKVAGEENEELLQATISFVTTYNKEKSAHKIHDLLSKGPGYDEPLAARVGLEMAQWLMKFEKPLA